ncbi:hypothetical protein LCGC14_0555610 [marine sediment metagenome]|uniref:Bacterial virulence protein VirB8 domain-containing protein n=1 Tax=marine sediment metagenome TaxID=412755 RepID=A0A0F9RNE8_9ZZZZ
MAKPNGGTKAKGNEGSVTLDDQVMSMTGLSGLIQKGLDAEREIKTKNRFILILLVALTICLVAITIMSGRETQVKLLGETTDGRIRSLPLLSNPIYTHSEVIAWSERCVKDIYRLSYVDWRTTIQNETLCLSDGSRSAFVNSLKEMGLLDKFTAENQGQLYAVPENTVIRSAGLSPTGYSQWIVDVPYKIVLDGRQRGQIDVVMSMKVRRVSLTWRETGLWVESYKITPKRG